MTAVWERWERFKLSVPLKVYIRMHKGGNLMNVGNVEKPSVIISPFGNMQKHPVGRDLQVSARRNSFRCSAICTLIKGHIPEQILGHKNWEIFSVL